MFHYMLHMDIGDHEADEQLFEIHASGYQVNREHLLEFYDKYYESMAVVALSRMQYMSVHKCDYDTDGFIHEGSQCKVCKEHDHKDHHTTRLS